MRGEPTQLLGFQVAEDNDCGALHSRKRNELLQPGSDLSDLTIANVNLLAPELVTVWMLPAFNDLADADIHLSDIRHDGSGSGLWLLHLLLLLLLGLLLLLLILLWCFFFLFFFWSCPLGLLRLLLVVLLLLLLLLAFVAAGSCSLVTTSCFLGFGRLCLREFLHLRLRHGSARVYFREARKDSLPVDLLEHAWKVLNVVDPSECIRQGKFLWCFELRAEKRRQSRKDDNICGSDALAD